METMYDTKVYDKTESENSDFHLLMQTNEWFQERCDKHQYVKK